MARNRTISLSGSESKEINLFGSYLSAFVSGIQWSEQPTSGNLLIEYADKSGTWRKFRAGDIEYPTGQAVNASVKADYINAIRITTTGITADVTVSFYLTGEAVAALDERIYGGPQAINVQEFVESNVKNGVQWEASAKADDLANGEALCITLTTGSKPVLIKGAIPQLRGGSLSAAWYRSPTVSGGNTLDIYNPNDETQGTREVTGLYGVTGTDITVSAVGTQVSSTFDLLGDAASSQNQRTPTTEVRGFERVLRPNTTYLARLLNDSGDTVDARLYLTWYEGPLSTDL